MTIASYCSGVDIISPYFELGILRVPYAAIDTEGIQGSFTPLGDDDITWGVASCLGQPSPFVWGLMSICVGYGPERQLELDRFTPCLMHSIHFVGGMILRGEIWLDGFIDDGDKADDVSERNVWGGADVISFIFLQRGVAECDLLLVVEPFLVIGSKTGVEDPLLEAEIAFREIVR